MKKVKILFLSCVFPLIINSQQYIVDSSFYISGWNKTIYCLEVIKDTLIIAGGFDTAGGVPANLIARYTNGEFYAMGMGNTNGDVVYCGAAYKGMEYYGGGFASMGNVPHTDAIAGWDGNQYFSIGNCTTPQSHYYDMVVWHDTLFVGGLQGEIDGHMYWGIFAYNGIQLIDVGILDSPFALAVFNNQVYAVGGSVQLQRYLGGTTWESVGSTGFYGKDLLVDTINNFLYTTSGKYVGTSGNIITTDGVAIWNGFYWEKVGYGNGDSNPGTNNLALYRGDIYISPNIDSVGGMYTGRLARWDGQDWYMVGNPPLGLHNNIVIYDLEVYKDTLYIGSESFSPTLNGTDTLNYGINRYYMPPDTTCKYLKPRVFTEVNTDTFELSGGQIEVQFYNNNAYVQTWDWDFGDSGTSNTKDPTHIYTDTGIYNVCVTVNDTGCVKTACKTITIVDDTGIGILNVENPGFKLYPNPTSNTLYIEITDKLLFEKELQIVDMNGKTLKTVIASEAKQSVDIKSLPKGVYFVKIGDKTERFVKE